MAADATIEKAAAAKRLAVLVAVILNSPKSKVSVVPGNPGYAQHFAGGVPNLKNGRILGFLDPAKMNHPFINPKGWEIIPFFGLGDFAPWPLAFIAPPAYRS